MNFTKEDAYKELVAKMTTNGEKLNLSERSMNEQLETLMGLIQTEEMELNAFIEKTLPLFKTADANIRNDVSNGIKDYQAKHPITQPTQPQVVKSNDDAKANGVDELERRLAEMEAKILASEKKEKDFSIKNQIIAKLKEKGVKNEEWAKALVNEITITDDFDVESKVNDYMVLYNKMSLVDYDPDATPKKTGNGQKDTIGNAIKEAAQFAKSQHLIS